MSKTIESELAAHEDHDAAPWSGGASSGGLAPTKQTIDFAELRHRFLAAQLEGNRREALRLTLDACVSRGASIADVQLKVIQEAQRELGRLWEEDRINIAQEHMATAIAQLALAHLYQYAPPAASTGQRILVACVEGELHEFPARLVGDALDLAGFTVKYLGASVPTASLLAMIEQEHPDLLALSVTMSFNTPALREAVAQVRAATAGRLPIIIGGHACRWSKGLAAELGVDGTAADAAEVVTLAQRLLRRRL